MSTISEGISPIEAAIDAIKAGRPVIVADNENRENEGDVIISAELATAEWIAWTVRWASGLLCAPTTNELADPLHPPLTVARHDAARAPPPEHSPAAAPRPAPPQERMPRPPPCHEAT